MVSPGVEVVEFGGMSIAQSSKEAGNMDPRFGEPDQAFQNRQKLIEPLGLQAENIAVIFPQSRNGFINFGLGSKKFNPARPLPYDGLVTDEPEVGLMLNAADCIPLAMHDEQAGVLALAHLGWRGIVGNLHEKMIDFMAGQYDFDASRATAYMGPSIGPDSYKAKTRDNSQKTPLWNKCIKRDPKTGLLHFDFPKYVTRQLVGLGFYEERISVSSADTGANDEYYSFTRHKSNPDMIPDGRNGFVVCQ